MYRLLSLKNGEWSFLRGMCYFLAFTMFFINCSPESFSGSDALNDDVPIPMGNNGLDVYDALEIFRTLDYSKDFQSSDEILEYVIGDEAFAQTIIPRSNLSAELELYKSLGYDDYISHAQTKGYLSDNMKEWLIAFQDNIVDFLDTNPDADATMAYFSNVDNFIFTNSYSSNEVQLIEYAVNTLKGFSKYYYLHYSDTSNDLLNSISMIDLRDADCNFIEGLLCGLLFAVVFILIIWAIYAALAAGVAAGGGAYTITKGGVIVASGTADLSGEFTILVGFFIVAGFSALWNSFFEWCCGKKEEIFCTPPIGHIIKELDCNEFEITFYGAGDYTLTSWKNENTIPEAVVTITPTLIFTVPDPDEESILSIKPTICTELPSGLIKKYEKNASGIMNQFSVAWQSTPPATIVLSNLEDPENPDWFFANVKTGDIISGFSSSSSYSYDWDITGDHQLMPQGPKAHIELDISDLGMFTLSVEVTDECTGIVDNLSKNINLIE